MIEPYLIFAEVQYVHPIVIYCLQAVYMFIFFFLIVGIIYSLRSLIGKIDSKIRGDKDDD